MIVQVHILTFFCILINVYPINNPAAEERERKSIVVESIAAANIFDKWLTSREMSIFNSFQNLTKLACVQCHSPLSTDEDRAPTILSSCTCHFFLIIQGDFLIPYINSQKYSKSLKKVKSYLTNLK